MVDGASLKGIARPPHGVLAVLALVEAAGLSRMSSPGSTRSRDEVATSSMWIRGVLAASPLSPFNAFPSSSADAFGSSGCKLAEEPGKYHRTRLDGHTKGTPSEESSF